MKYAYEDLSDEQFETKAIFGEVTDAVRDAARMATGRISSPAQLLETCEVGLSAILK
jgi:hypothetical protein